MMKKLAEEERTMVFYESPMRLVKTLNDLPHTLVPTGNVA